MKEKLNRINNKWVRLVVFIIVAINSGAMIMGYQLLPFNNDEIVAGLSVFAMVISEIWNHWKNNSYTNDAKEADKIMESKKRKRKKNKRKGVV